MILHVPTHVYETCLVAAEVGSAWPEPTVTQVGGGRQVLYRGISARLAREIVRHCRARAAEQVEDEAARRAYAWCENWLARGERTAA